MIYEIEGPREMMTLMSRFIHKDCLPESRCATRGHVHGHVGRVLFLVSPFVAVSATQLLRINRVIYR
jgi:hypothetical protein